MYAVTHKSWLEWRRNGIGSSDAPVVMNASPWKTRGELWAEKLGLVRRSQPVSAPMRRGRDLEPLARGTYEKLTGIQMPARCLEHKKHPFLRASFDGLNLDEGLALEIKCPGKADHKEAKNGRIPKKYLWQCVHLLLVSGLDRLDYFSFDGERGVLVPFRRSPSLEKKLLAAEIDFWRYIVDRVPPPEAAERPQARIDGIFAVRRSR